MATSATRVKVTSPFWRRYQRLVKEVVLPYQWDVLTDSIAIDLPVDPAGNTLDIPRSGAIENLRVAAGRAKGPFVGFPFQDSDVYKWLEAVSYALEGDADEVDAELRTKADTVVDLIADAQMDDGYLDSYFQINGIGRRFKRIEQSHELYVMGHYIEAGVAYWQATGNERALEIARRMADCIERNFGPEEGKIHGADGHPEVELALAKLYEVTGTRRYLNLAHWLILVRGQDPDFYRRQNEADGIDADLFDSMRNLPLTYLQAAEPVLEQQHADGHAVRMTYLLTGMAHVARLAGDNELVEACRRLWTDIVRRRMYVTGQIGSTQVGESFTFDYDLPNDTVYGETCASVAMSFFARRMLEIEPKGEYGDVLERELFNGTIAGMSLDGRHFFYVNPLEADPEASREDPDKRHVLTRRAEWFGCACCPANLARLIVSLNRYIYTELDGGATVLLHQFVASEAEFASGLRVRQEGDYPWSGDIKIEAENTGTNDVRLGVRVPRWARDGFRLFVDDVEPGGKVADGFVYVVVPAGRSVSVRLELPMSVRQVRASNRVREDVGKVAVMRGPVVFCMEEADNEGPLWLYELARGPMRYTFDADLLGGVGTVEAEATRDEEDPESGELYVDAEAPRCTDATARLVPYYAWANREEGQMQVWVRSIEV